MPKKIIDPDLAEEIIDVELNLSRETSSALADRIANDDEYRNLLLANDDRAFVDYKLTMEQRTALIEATKKLLRENGE